MSDGDTELIGGDGKAWRDFGGPNPNLKQARMLLAAKIIGVMDDRERRASPAPICRANGEG